MRPPLHIFLGEEFLVRQASRDLINEILPAHNDFNLIPMEGRSPREIRQELLTLPMFPGPKVVLVKDPEFIAPSKGRSVSWEQAKASWAADKHKEAARRLLSLSARAGWGAASLIAQADTSVHSTVKWKKELDIELSVDDFKLVREIATFALQERITAPDNDLTALIAMLEIGLPEGHFLVIVGTEADPKNLLIKWAARAGRLIECKVADRFKDLDIAAFAERVLNPFDKRLSSQAEEMLKRRCGRNMRLLQGELEKLALYSVSSEISAADVELLVGQAREEEFAELADALAKRDFAAALAYCDQALGQGQHALQLLGALATIVRQLIENSERVRRWVRGSFPSQFGQFKTQIFTEIEKELKAENSKVPHPYAVFLGMQSASRYTLEALLRGLSACAETDLALKSSGNGQLLIERLLLEITRK